MPTADHPLGRLHPSSTATALLATLVLAVLVADLSGLVGWIPSWLSVGDATVPVLVVGPAVLGVVVAAGVVAGARDGERVGPYRAFQAVLAGATLLASAYALYVLNVREPGVFWAGVPAVFLGASLAVTVLVEAGVGRLRSPETRPAG